MIPTEEHVVLNTELRESLLETYHGIGYKVWELREKEDPIELNEIIKEESVNRLLMGKIYLVVHSNSRVEDIIMREKMKVTYHDFKILVDAFEITPDGVNVDAAEPKPNLFVIVNSSKGTVLLDLRPRKTIDLTYGEFIDAVKKLSNMYELRTV